MSQAQDCAVALGHREAAAVLYDLLVPYGDMVVFNVGTCEGAASPEPRAFGSPPRAVPIRPKPTSARRSQSMSASEAPYWIARTQLDYADLLWDVERTDEATELVDHALETAKTFGFAALESRATEFSA